MSAALTHPFVTDANELTKDFLSEVSPVTKTTELRYRSRAMPSMDRRTVGVGLLRNLQPVVFDASNPDHRRAWAVFYTTGKWTHRFILELPWDNVPQMLLDKMCAEHAQRILLETCHGSKL